MARRALGAALAIAAAVALACKASGGGDGDEELTCEAGWHACGNDCAPDASPFSCGTRCEPCPVPAYGQATCAAGACGIECDTGFHACGGAACEDDASVTACGESCSVCPAPGHEHSRAVCTAGVCGYACALGYLVCDGGCCEAPAAGSPRLIAGNVHTCAIAEDGDLWCWGSNEQGRLGMGSMTPARSTTRVPVVGFGAGDAVQVGAGWAHACGIDGAGAAWCWGNNAFHQLGNGDASDQASPAAVLGVSAALMADGGWAHSCALLENGTAKCWGNGELGVLGDGNVYPGWVPVVSVKGLAGAYALASGYQFNCALTGLAEMACWGDNRRGQLGNAAADVTLEADPIAASSALGGVARLRAVALGFEHGCVAYDTDGVSGAVRCWGRGDSGQLGNGAKPAAQRTPVEVAGLENVTALAAGQAHTCALTSSGAVLCWGANPDGQLGNGTNDEALTPTPVSGLSSDVLAIAAGSRHTCAIVRTDDAGEDLFCWGWNFEGQLGDGGFASRSVPVAVTGF